jgi:hypothetical protein
VELARRRSPKEFPAATEVLDHPHWQKECQVEAVELAHLHWPTARAPLAATEEQVHRRSPLLELTTLLLQLLQGTWAYSPPRETTTEGLYTELFHFGTKVLFCAQTVNIPDFGHFAGLRPWLRPAATEFSSIRMGPRTDTNNSTEVLASPHLVRT